MKDDRRTKDRQRLPALDQCRPCLHVALSRRDHLTRAVPLSSEEHTRSACLARRRRLGSSGTITCGINQRGPRRSRARGDDGGHRNPCLCDRHAGRGGRLAACSLAAKERSRGLAYRYRRHLAAAQSEMTDELRPGAEAGSLSCTGSLLRQWINSGRDHQLGRWNHRLIGQSSRAVGQADSLKMSAIQPAADSLFHCGVKDTIDFHDIIVKTGAGPRPSCGVDMTACLRALLAPCPPWVQTGAGHSRKRSSSARNPPDWRPPIEQST